MRMPPPDLRRERRTFLNFLMTTNLQSRICQSNLDKWMKLLKSLMKRILIENCNLSERGVKCMKMLKMKLKRRLDKAI